MKAISMVVAFIFALFVSSQAYAASWAVVDKVEEGEIQIITSVDKDSIKRATNSAKFPKYNRSDGFSAIIKLEINAPSMDRSEMMQLVSFYNENGTKKYCVLEGYGENSGAQSESDVIIANVDTDGEVWIKVWNFIEKNIK